MRSGFILEGERETHLHRVAFRTLTEAALSPAESRAAHPGHRRVPLGPPVSAPQVQPPNPRPLATDPVGYATDRIADLSPTPAT